MSKSDDYIIITYPRDDKLYQVNIGINSQENVRSKRTGMVGSSWNTAAASGSRDRERTPRKQGDRRWHRQQKEEARVLTTAGDDCLPIARW